MTADLPLSSTVRRTGRDTRRRDRLVVLALGVMFAAGLVGMAAATGWRETFAHVARLSAWQVLVLLALSLTNYVLRGLRWHVFTRRLGLPTGIWQDVRHFLGGLAMAVTPGRVGELVRLRWLSRETGWRFTQTAPLALVDRASDLAAMAIILGVSILLAAGGIRGALPVTLLALIGAYIATRPALAASIVEILWRLSGRRAPRFFARARNAALSLQRFSHGGVLAAALALGLVGWFAEGYSFHLLLGWMGADVGLAKAIAIFIFASLAGGLTGAPGGVGGAEAAMIALLTYDGVPLGAAVAATAIIRVTTLWFAIVIGLFIFPIAERHSQRAQPAPESL